MKKRKLKDLVLSLLLVVLLLTQSIFIFITLIVPSSANASEDTYTKLLLHMDGADNGTSFIDELGHTVTVYGNAKMVASVKKFGTASASFDGDGDYISLSDSEDWNFGNDDFTIDFWANFNALATLGYYGIFGQYGESTSQRSFFMDKYSNGYFYFDGRFSDGSTFTVGFPQTGISTGKWHHIAIIRHAGYIKVYVNGVEKDSTNVGTKAFNNSPNPLLIGAFVNSSGNTKYLNGYIDEFRISKGVARWTSEFTPPSRPYDPQVAVTGVSLQPKTMTLTAGGTSGTLVAKFTPENASNTNVIWSTSNPAVATVSNGIVTPVAAGTATITITTEDGGFNDNCIVTVNPDTTEHARLLLHMDGADNGTVFTDELGHTVTVCGNARTVTAVKKFGTASASFDGDGDYISLSDSEDWNFGNDDFTIDFWVNFNVLSTLSYYGIFGQNGASTSERSFIMDKYSNGYFYFDGRFTDGSTFTVGFPQTGISTGKWHHIAIVRHAGYIKAYVNGIEKDSTNVGSKALNNSSQPLMIGAFVNNSGNTKYLDGYIDEFRISKGIARWTSDFTPPTGPYSLGGSNSGDNQPPVLIKAEANSNTIELTYNEILSRVSIPVASDYSIMIDNSCQNNPQSVVINENKVILTLATTITAGQTILITYTPGTNPVRDTAGNLAANLKNQPVINLLTESDVLKLIRGTINGDILTLEYNASLDAQSIPDVHDFSVSVNGSLAALSSVNILTNKVFLALSSPVTASDSIMLSYSPGSNPIRSEKGVSAAPINNLRISNQTPAGSIVAPELNPSGPTTIYDSTAFLYTGDNPIQTGVAEGTIKPNQAAVVRGKLISKDEVPLSGVTVTIADHPEFGSTVSRSDGYFDMAVNGGTVLTVNFNKEGYLPVQRQINVPWQDYTVLDDVMMVPYDTQANHVVLGANSVEQVVRGSQVFDSDGERQATLIIPAGTTGQMILPDGSVQNLTSITVRATEYTVGDNGPKCMPAELPPNVAYTYCVEYSADEAVAAGAINIQFNKPLIHYVENFLGFPVGQAVPTGYYDRTKKAWIPSDNGRIIKILSIDNGIAQIDIDGSGQPASADALANLGISDTELQKLASLYQAGQSLWRVPITHFTPWDCNWPYGPPAGAKSPKKAGVKDPIVQTTEKPCTGKGSIIEYQNQVLGLSQGITGTPLTLYYRSGNTPGYKTRLDIPLTGETLPGNLLRIVLSISVAGRVFAKEFIPTTNLTYTFGWDGKDAYGRLMKGGTLVEVSIGYVYPAVYQMPGNSFGDYSGIDMDANRTRMEITMWDHWKATIMPPERNVLESLQNLGGWTIDKCHSYDPVNKILYLGDGSYRNANTSTKLEVTTFAGTGEMGSSGDGGPANKARLGLPAAVAAGQDGSIYIVDTLNCNVRKVDPAGIISTFAGTGGAGYSGDGQSAKSAMLNFPTGIAIGPDGSVYISDTFNNCIRKVSPDGVITTVAGSGPSVNVDMIRLLTSFEEYLEELFIQNAPEPGEDVGDGGPALQAKLHIPAGIAVAPDGTLYIADYMGSRIRRVDPNGIITTIIGTGIAAEQPESIEEPVPVSEVQLGHPLGACLGDDGSIYVLQDDGSMLKLEPDGKVISMELGVVKAGLLGVSMVTDTDVYKFKESAPYLKEFFATGPDGAIYYSSPGASKVLKTGTPTPWMNEGKLYCPSEDGTEIYIFDDRGRHLKTVNALTGSTIYTFSYDLAGRLAAIEDADGNITTIERDSIGNPLAIVAPNGQKTVLGLDDNHYLTNITSPQGKTTTYIYDSEGLIRTYIDAKGNQHNFEYDQSGKLTKDQNPAGGYTALSSTSTQSSWTVTATTAMNRARSYTIEKLPTGETRYIKTLETGAEKKAVEGTDRTLVQTYPDGTEVTTVEGPDPRWGMLAPINNTMTVKTPGGLTLTAKTTRTVTLTNPENPLSIQSIVDNIDVNGNVFTSTYDGTNRTITNQTPVGRTSVITLDDKGRTIQEQVSRTEPISYTYEQGLLKEVRQGNLFNTFTYDDKKRLKTITDSAGNQIVYEYYEDNQVKSMRLPNGATYQFEYDDNGNRTRVIMPNGAVHQLNYTVNDQGAGYTPPGSPGYINEYDLDGSLKTITLPSGRVINNEFDSAGRPAGITYNAAAINMSYSDGTSRVSSITRTPSGGGTPEGITYSYDGELLTGVTISGSVNGQFTYRYDNNFNLVGITMNGGPEIAITRDADGLLTAYGSFSFSRSGPAGAPDSISDGKMTVTLQYDSMGRLQTRTHTVNGQEVYKLELDYNSTGLVWHKTETVGGSVKNYEYIYDANGQLTNVNLNGSPYEAYTYDINGNRLTRQVNGGQTESASYDPNDDRLLQQGSVTYQFDADGFMTNRGSDTFQYSAQGELLQANAGGKQISYKYDGLGRRIARTDETGTYQYLYGNPYNPFQVTAMRDPAGNLSTYYYDTTGLLIAIECNGTRYYVTTDQVGTPKAVVDETGQAIKLLEYDSFGNLISDSNPDFYLPVGFAGGLADSSTGLIRFGFRDYDPVSGRWAAKDPVLFAGAQANLFTYCGNNPVNLVDRWGLRAEKAPCQADDFWSSFRDSPDKNSNEVSLNNNEDDYVISVSVKFPKVPLKGLSTLEKLTTSAVTFCPKTGQIGLQYGFNLGAGASIQYSPTKSAEGWYYYGECIVIGGLQDTYGPLGSGKPKIDGSFGVGLSTGIGVYYNDPDVFDLY